MRKYAAVVCGIMLAMGVAAGLALADGPTVVPIQVSPATINLAQKGTWVTVHADIPYSEVLRVEAVVELNGVPVAWTKADNQGNLVAKFQVDAVKGIIAEPSAEVTLTGDVDGDVYFSGSETVRVIDQAGNR